MHGMLVLDEAQLQRMSHHRRLAFAQALMRRLVTEFPALLQPLPPFVQAAMVCHGLDTAQRLGFTLESTLGEFVALQCASAADFHQHPQARSILMQTSLPQAQRLQGLHQALAPATWHQIKAGADLRAWFSPERPQDLPTRIAARVCSEFPALAHQVAEPVLRDFFYAMPARAQGHGITAESGMVVLAAALAWYGDRLDHAHGPRWACELLFGQPPLAAARIVAGLRHALLLDSGRLV